MGRFSFNWDEEGHRHEEGELEGQLSSILSPVKPNPEFVSKLKHRLTTQPAIVVERRSEATIFVLASLGLFVGAVLVWLLYTLRLFFNRKPEAG